MPATATVVSLSALLLTLAGFTQAREQRPPAAPDLTAEEILQRVRALYPNLRSYADSGTVVEETQGFVNRSSFRTYFLNAPRNFLFDYRQIVSEYRTGQRVPLTGRVVIWMLRGHLQSWSSALGTHEEYPEGSNQLAPFVSASAPTTGAALLIPSLIYVKANFRTTLQELGDVTLDGIEQLRGRRCYKLVGVARSVYPSGQVVDVRPAVVWVDAETFLIRQIFTDTPKGYRAGSIRRITVTYEPQLDPALPDSLFMFTVPSSQQ